MRLGLDLDDVLYSWESTARFLLKGRGFNLPVSTSWTSIHDAIGDEEWEWLWTVGVEKGLFLHGNTYQGGFETLLWLNEQGHDIVLLTARPKKAAIDTWSWIAYHRIPAVEVHILGPKAKKSQVACDLYLDDSPSNVKELQEAGKMVILFDRPWNRDVEGVCRVESWEAFKRFVEQMDSEEGA